MKGLCHLKPIAAHMELLIFIMLFIGLVFLLLPPPQGIFTDLKFSHLTTLPILLKLSIFLGEQFYGAISFIPWLPNHLSNVS